MTGLLVDKKGATVLLVAVMAAVWHNGYRPLSVYDLYVARDILTSWCVLTMIAFLPAVARAETSKWQWPWTVVSSGQGGPPSNAWPEQHRMQYLELKPVVRSEVRCAGEGPPCKAWPENSFQHERPRRRQFSYSGMVREWNPCTFH